MNALLRLLSQHKIAQPAKKFGKTTKRATHHQPLLGSRQAPLPRRRTPPPTRSSSATMRRIQFRTTATITLHCRVHNLPRKAVSILFNRLPALLLVNITTIIDNCHGNGRIPSHLNLKQAQPASREQNLRSSDGTQVQCRANFSRHCSCGWIDNIISADNNINLLSGMFVWS